METISKCSREQKENDTGFSNYFRNSKLNCLIPISCGTFELFSMDRQFYRLVLLIYNEHALYPKYYRVFPIYIVS